MPSRPLDLRARPLRDLRISVTDRCNFRCPYCMPGELFGDGYAFLPRAQILTFEEIERLARVFVSLGVTKVRLTGGEPLLRRDLPRLVEMLAGISGVADLALTTNGSLLAPRAKDLASAGLHRVTVSLDALDAGVAAEMSGVGSAPARVLEGIDAALAAGLSPLKVNMVVKRGANERSVLPMARRFRGTGVILRFIEYMDVGTTNGWRLEDVVPAREILEELGRVWPLEPIEVAPMGRVARRYRYVDGGGEVGVVASVTEPFCTGCTRARLTAEGMLYGCLFATRGVDLKTPLREDLSDEDLADLLRGWWRARDDRYSEERAAVRGGSRQKVEMPRMGG